MIIFLILKFLSECDIEYETERLAMMAEEEEVITTRTPLINEPSEATWKGDLETALFSSSDDVDYSTLCVICFEERRNCFFVPCGHSATCRGCAQRILSEESKVCPICRRVIRKSKRLGLKLWTMLLFLIIIFVISYFQQKFSMLCVLLIFNYNLFKDNLTLFEIKHCTKDNLTRFRWEHYPPHTVDQWPVLE